MFLDTRAGRWWFHSDYKNGVNVRVQIHKANDGLTTCNGERLTALECRALAGVLLAAVEQSARDNVSRS